MTSNEARGEPGTSASDSGEPEPHFITHEVSKLDTLAGLAIRYNVSVSDIKRCNGLLSESGIYARQKILIPVGHLPLGKEYSTWAGMIVTHYGSLGNSPRKHPGHSTQLLALLQGGTGRRGCASASASARASDDEDDGCHILFTAAQRNIREVELSPLGDDVGTSGGEPASAADERLRRRIARESASASDLLLGASQPRSDQGHIPQNRAPVRPRPARQQHAPGRGMVMLSGMRSWAQAHLSSLRAPGRGAAQPAAAQLQPLQPLSRQRAKNE